MAYSSSAPTTIPTHNAQGTVTAASLRNFNSKAGKALTKTVVQIDGVDVELDGFGDKRAAYPVGMSAGFAVAKAYGRWNAAGGPQPGLPNVAADPVATPTAAKSSGYVGASSGPRGSFPIKGDDYQTSIIRQNSLTNATNLVKALFADMGAGEMTREDAAKQADWASDLAIRVAYKFASFSSGNLDIRAAQEIANKALAETAE